MESGKYKLIVVSPVGERIADTAETLEDACRIGLDNTTRFSLWIVECPDGHRLSVSDQRGVLKIPA